MQRIPPKTSKHHTSPLKLCSLTPMRPMPVCACVCAVISVTALYSPKFLAIIFSVLIFLLFAAFCRFKTFVVPILLIFVMLASAITALVDIGRISSLEGQTVSATVTVLEDPQQTKYGYSAIVRTDSETVLPENFKMLIYYDGYALETGDRFDIAVKLQSLDDYRTYYYSEGIYLCGSLKREPVLVGTDRGAKALDLVRDYIKNTLYANISADEAATLNALTVGERTGFSDEYSLAVRRAGVSHVMVVSGMHLAVIMKAVFFCTDLLAKNKLLRAISAGLGVLMLCALCGFTVSIMRAGITYILMALAPLLNRESDPLNTLCLAAVIILLHTPFALFSISFQLSVLATLGILVVSPSLVGAVNRRIPWAKFASVILSPLIMTLSATLLTLPVTVWHFEEVSLIAPVSNVLISFAVTAALICSMAALAINMIPLVSVLAVPLFVASGIFTKYINYVILWLGGSENVVFKLKRAWAFVIAGAALFIVLVITYRKNRVYRKELIKIQSKERNNADFI